MKSMKRFLSILLAAGMLLSVTACSGDNSSASADDGKESSSIDSGNSGDSSDAGDSGDSGVVEDYDPFGKYEEEVKMTAATAISATASDVDWKNNPWVAKYKEVFNVAIDYVFLAPQEQYDQRISLMMTDPSQIPDCFTTSLIQTQQLIEAELLEPQTEAWENYVSDFAYGYMMTNGTVPFDVVTVDGELYGMPWVQPAIETVHTMFVNEAWRKDLGLEEPTTLETFEKMIYAFAEQDPNGNGQKDEFGLGLSKNIWDVGFEAYSFCNIFGAYPDAWLQKDDGTVYYGSVQPEMKPALEKLAQYYKDGLIDPEWIVKTYEQEAELVTKEQLGVMFGVQWTGMMSNCLGALYLNYYDEGKNPDDLEWKSYPIPSLDGSEVAEPIIFDNTSKFTVVKAGFEHPEIVTKMVNYIHFLGIGPQGEGPEGHPELAVTRMEYWGQDEDGNELDELGLWDCWANTLFAPETIHANIERWNKWFAIIEDDDEDAKEWCANNYLASADASDIVNFRKDGHKMINSAGKQDIGTASWRFIAERIGETFMYGLDMKEKGTIKTDVRGAFVSDTMVDKQASLDSLELQEITRIITGDSTIDAFDSFVANWKANGGDQITAEMQEYVDSMG